MYQVKVTPAFEKDVKKLDSQVAKRIIQKIEYLLKILKI
jgi:mRNA-degrading endonuclease RelE of RelBE toxin-antitoxin system